MKPHAKIQCDACEWGMSVRLVPDAYGTRYVSEHPVPMHHCANGGQSFTVTEIVRADDRGLVPEVSVGIYDEHE